jgi:hypothetical protein
VQRHAVWSLEQKQNLIDSIIFDYPIPPIYFVDRQDSFYWALDGQQRCRAIAEFINDKFPLSDTIGMYFDSDAENRIVTEIKGKKYSELHKDVQTKINSSNIGTYIFSNITDDEIAVMFRRLNSGTAFKNIELVRVDAGTEVTKFVNNISKTDFWEKSTKITNKQKIRFTDSESIMQAMMLLESNYSGFNANAIKQFAIDLKDGLLTGELKNRFTKITNYMGSAFPEATKYMKKVNIPIIYKIAEEAIEKNVDSNDFFDCVNTFFVEDITQEYIESTSKGSGKAQNIVTRIEILGEYFRNNINRFAEADSLKAV